MLDFNFSSASSALSKVNAKVELYEGSTLVTTCTCNDRLQDLTIERLGQSNKFFGFGIIHKLTVNFIDLERTLTINKDTTSFKVYFGYDDFIKPYPTFYTFEISRDENTNTITVVAYDALYKANNHTVAEVEEPYTVEEYAASATRLLGVTAVKFLNFSEFFFDDYQAGGANFEGTEGYKDSLDAISEITQTVYYVDSEDKLVFKRLDISGDPVLTINKEEYYDFESSETRTLTAISNVTELGDNVSSSLVGQEGETQYVRNNPFWELRTDIGNLLDSAMADVGGLSITQFMCQWDGNFLLEIGDKIALVTEDNNIITSYVFNDVVTYDSLMSETTQWTYEKDSETESNPSSLGETLKQTYARVDKANKQISLVASETSANKDNIAALTITTDNITTNVRNIETNLNGKIDGLNDNYETLSQEVSTKVSATDVTIAIEEERRKGAEKVTTSTGFTFDSEGLTITKSDSEISTNIDEDGLSVFKNDEEVLTADNSGVQAKNLHATTYLIIGENTYFADFTSEDGKSRAGCFWTGK